MRVGILTFHHTTNYGALLQSISLYRVIEEFGHSVELVDYRPMGALRQSYLARVRGLFKGSLFVEKKTREFARVLSGYEIGPCVYTNNGLQREYESRYDLVITGSDEVWNTVGPRGFDLAYFLDFARNGTRKVSYAATAGKDSWEKGKRDKIRNALLKFESLSVRDESTANLVAEVGLTRPEVVLDPTLLVTDWKVGDRPLSGKYVFVSGQLPEPEQKKVVQIARERGLKIVSGGYAYGNIDPDKVVLNPLEWVSAIGNAEIVMTSLFHAMAFCLNLKRKCYVFVSDKKKKKMLGLLDCLGVDAALSAGFSEKPIDGATIDDFTLKRFRESSTSFLNKAINDWK